MVAAQAGIEQGLAGQRRIPIRRDTGLIQDGITLIPNQLTAGFERFDHYRMAVAVTQAFERIALSR